MIRTSLLLDEKCLISQNDKSLRREEAASLGGGVLKKEKHQQFAAIEIT